MYNQISHDQTTSNVLSWTNHCSNVELASEEEAADADEPPPHSPVFQRGPVRRGSEHHESLLTKALHSQSEEETNEDLSSLKARRRRSITSTASLASTAELTCSTGITTPARTSSPSPRVSDVGFVPLAAKAPLAHIAAASPGRDLKVSNAAVTTQDPAVVALQKKRCISFACAAKPVADSKRAVSPPPAKPADDTPKSTPQAAPKRSCIRFACTSRPSGKGTPPPRKDVLATTPVPAKAIAANKDMSSAAVLKQRSPSTVRSLRSLTPRRASHSPVAVRNKKYLTANSGDLQSEDSWFHEFARDEPQEDDWIRRVDITKQKLTINDTLQKENAIRKLGKEAEEEAELEDDIDEEEDEEVPDGDDLDNLDDEEENKENDEGEDQEPELEYHSGYSSDDDATDGYNTDNEVGFASSDEEDDGLDIWNLSRTAQELDSGNTFVQRRTSFSGHHSDSSTVSKRNIVSTKAKRDKTNHVDIRSGTPELPDSTDFVCGTLDEDRPLEEAYLSCIAARKKEKLRPIPQDIDPSFPASEPENEEGDAYQQEDSDDQLWLHGELEDIHHEQQDRAGRKKKPDNQSPKRYRSPPPKRHHSPPPKARGRSPRRLFDHQSPRKFKSPPPQLVKSPPASPVQTSHGIAFKALAFRPGLTQTKSLPKAVAMFPQLKGRKNRAGTISKHDQHVRGAIDIVKGLEEKRQLRKEKFYQKYCQNRARKERERVQERKPPRGQGAERMREIGLLMAGKIGQGNYVLSV